MYTFCDAAYLVLAIRLIATEFSIYALKKENMVVDALVLCRFVPFRFDFFFILVILEKKTPKKKWMIKYNGDTNNAQPKWCKV